MTTASLSAAPEQAALSSRHFIGQARALAHQVRRALGGSGVLWAAMAGTLGIACCVGAVATITFSVRSAEVDRERARSASILTLDQSYRRLFRAILVSQSPDRQSFPGDLPVYAAWQRVQEMHGALCSQPADTPDSRQIGIVCRASDEIQALLGPEVAASDAARRLVDRVLVAQALAMHARINEQGLAADRRADLLIEHLSSDYRRAMLVGSLCTAGFAAAGLVLVLLLARASLRHYDERQKADAAHDFLRQALEALPAGIVLYDRDERLVMCNEMAASNTDGAIGPHAIGRTYAEICEATMARYRAAGIDPGTTTADWIARFRAKSGRSVGRSFGGRWVERFEQVTAWGGTVGIGVDVTDLKNREIEAERSRALLQETIDALPAGIALYDRNERLAMYNRAAMELSDGLVGRESLGRTFSELAHLTAERARSAGVEFSDTPDDWVARFRAKKLRSLRPLPGGRWLERFERATSSGGTVSVGTDVTDRVRREQELRRSRDMLQEMIDTMPAGVVLYDAGGRLVMFNKDAAKITACLLKPGAIGSTYIELAHRNYRELKAAGKDTGETPEQWIARFDRENERDIRLQPDGRWIEWSERVMSNGYKVGLRKDVTDLKNHEISAQRASAEYQALVDSMTDIVYALDIKGRFTFASAGAREVLGVAPSRLVGTRFRDWVPPEDVEKVLAAGRAFHASTADAVLHTHLRMVTGGGEVRHIEARSRKPLAGSGEGVVQVGVLRDITERVAMAERLGREQARLKSIVESSGALVMLADPNLRVLMVNREFEKFWGVRADDVVGRILRETAVGSGLDARRHGQWLSGESREPLQFSRTRRDAQGRERVLSVTASPIYDEAGVFRQIAFLGVDDTERRETEQALFDAERMSTVGEMAGTVAHEIAQPLQIINIASAAAQEEIARSTGDGASPDAAYLAARLQRICQQVDRAGHIIGELRAFVRGSSDDKEAPFAAGEAIAGAVDLTQHGAKQSGVALARSVAEGLPPLIGHLARFEQVLVNLVNNARDAGARRVELSARLDEREGRPVLRVAIDDDGPGIAPAVLARLFNSFVTTKERGKGTGLGLRICRRIVEEMGGTIAAANRPEGGACFEMLFPTDGKAASAQ